MHDPLFRGGIKGGERLLKVRGEAYLPHRSLHQFLLKSTISIKLHLCHHTHSSTTLESYEKKATRQEKQLWYQYLNTFPIRVYLQLVIGNYIVDFFCHHVKLVIELDGGQHYQDEYTNRDNIRTSFLESQGLFVLRFTNWEVDHQFAQVCQRIKEVADQRLVELARIEE